MTLFEFAQTFQTAIVGIVGFVGVITAQLLNASLIREREDIALRKRQEAITAIVRAELTIMRDAFLRPNPDEERTEGSWSRMTKMRRKATPPIMAELGLLETTSLETVLLALSTVDAVYDNLIIIAANDTETHIDFDSENWSLAAGALNSTGKRLELALQTLPPPKSVTHSAKR